MTIVGGRERRKTGQIIRFERMKRSFSISNLESIIEPLPHTFHNLIPIWRHFSEELPKGVPYEQEKCSSSRSMDSLLRVDAGNCETLKHASSNGCWMLEKRGINASRRTAESSIASDDEGGSLEGTGSLARVLSDASEVEVEPVDVKSSQVSAGFEVLSDDDPLCRLVHRRDLGFDEPIVIENAVGSGDDGMIVKAEDNAEQSQGGWPRGIVSSNSEVDRQIQALDAILDQHTESGSPVTTPGLNPVSARENEARQPEAIVTDTEMGQMIGEVMGNIRERMENEEKLSGLDGFKAQKEVLQGLEEVFNAERMEFTLKDGRRDEMMPSVILEEPWDTLEDPCPSSLGEEENGGEEEVGNEGGVVEKEERNGTDCQPQEVVRMRQRLREDESSGSGSGSGSGSIEPKTRARIRTESPSLARTKPSPRHSIAGVSLDAKSFPNLTAMMQAISQYAKAPRDASPSPSSHSLQPQHELRKLHLASKSTQSLQIIEPSASFEQSMGPYRGRLSTNESIRRVSPHDQEHILSKSRGISLDCANRRGTGDYERSIDEDQNGQQRLVKQKDLNEQSFDNGVGGGNYATRASMVVDVSARLTDNRKNSADLARDSNNLADLARDSNSGNLAPSQYAECDHRRWSSDQTTRASSDNQAPESDFKARLEQQIRRENSKKQKKEAKVRNALASGSRSQSQLALAPVRTSPVSRTTLKMKRSSNLSTSTPSVNIEEEARIARNDGRGSKKNTTMERVSAQTVEKNWSDLMPKTYAPHQIYGPFQPASRVVSDGAKAVERRRLEKKQQKKLMDYFPSVRKKKSDGHGPSIVANCDRRETVDGGQQAYSDFPDHLAKVLQDRPNTIGPSDGRMISAQVASGGPPFGFFTPDLNKPSWQDLELWKTDFPTWSDCHPHMKLGGDERKKQEAIYELYLTEKHYCQTLVILQQVYQEGLRVEKILSEDQRSAFIPPVLDALLFYHVNILRRVRQKRAEGALVDTVAPIIYAEFESTERSIAAVDAYVEICSKQLRSYKLYDDFCARNECVRRFFEKYENESRLKLKSFKMCFQLIIQRLSKYPLILHQMLKVERGMLRRETQRALEATMAFAQRVDSELEKIELNTTWEHMRTRIDNLSVGCVNGKGRFTFDDLMSLGKTQQLLFIGKALWTKNNQDKHEGTAVCLVLFEEILVTLTKNVGRNDRYVFHDSKNSVIPVQTLMLREMPRTTSVFFVVNMKPAFDLFHITFNSKSELEKWSVSFDRARATIARNPPNPKTGIVTAEMLEEDPEETRFNDAMLEWNAKLRELFDVRKREEAKLADYMEKRLEWFERLKQHIDGIPVKRGTEAQRTAVSEKIKASVKEKFEELRALRRSSLNTMVECASSLGKEQFRSFFDDVRDSTAGGAQTSDSTTSSDHSESDERSREQKLPKRNRTFNGTGSPQRETIRRRTTEPQLSSPLCSSRSEEQAVDAGTRKLGIGMSSRAHDAAKRLIRENVELRKQNDHLRSDIAMHELQLSSLKTRRLAATPANALEELRKKQHDLQKDEAAFNTNYHNEMSRIKDLEERLTDKEKELKTRETQLEEQWKAFKDATNADQHVSVHRPHSLQSCASATFRSGSAINERNVASASPVGSLGKSPSSSSMPLHLAEKSSKMHRPKKF